MKRYWFLAAFGCACLSFAAVWLGGLNQDEGWYLYAANLAHEGQKVYGDFAFTQGPVMPKVYSAFTWIWAKWGLLGARAFTLLLGLLGILFAALTARKLAPEGKGNAAALIVVMLLGCNLYHLYYLAIPKTYALASMVLGLGVWGFVSFSKHSNAQTSKLLFVSGLCFAVAAGVRISLGAVLPVVGIALLMRRDWTWVWFGVGGVVGLALSYGMVLLDPATFKGFLAAQSYHAARGGFDLTWAVGSLSRLVRWYLPIFIVLGLGVGKKVEKVGGGGQWRGLPLLVCFLAVFAVQMAAPFPYEDYQVPIMGLLAVFAAVNFVDELFSSPPPKLLLVLGLTFASSFGSPLLEKWSTNGQDRFWSLKKEKCELAQLRDAAKRIEEIDPDGKEIFTQDLYLAIETNRKVPKGLEMGPFSILTDAEWRKLIASAPCKVAAVSGYTFAIEPPKCNERPFEQQLEYLKLLKENYSAVDRIADFGQNATTLLLLKRNEKVEKIGGGVSTSTSR